VIRGWSTASWSMCTIERPEKRLVRRTREVGGLQNSDNDLRREGGTKKEDTRPVSEWGGNMGKGTSNKPSTTGNRESQTWGRCVLEPGRASTDRCRKEVKPRKKKSTAAKRTRARKNLVATMLRVKRNRFYAGAGDLRAQEYERA